MGASRSPRRGSGSPGESSNDVPTPDPDEGHGGSIRDEGSSGPATIKAVLFSASRDPDRCALRETALLHTSASPIRYLMKKTPFLLAAVVVASPAFGQNDECTGALALAANVSDGGSPRQHRCGIILLLSG